MVCQDARGHLAYLAGEDPVRRVGLIGRPAVQLFPDDAAFPGHLERTLAGARFTALVHSGDKVLETLFYPAYSTEGAIDGVSGISVDTRVAAEADQGRLRTALQHAAHEWRTTFDAIDAPAVLIAPDDTVRRVNRATRDLWGRPYEEIVGSRLPERGPGLPWASIRQATTGRAEVAGSPSPCRRAMRRTRPTGTSRPTWSATREMRPAPSSPWPATSPASWPCASPCTATNACR